MARSIPPCWRVVNSQVLRPKLVEQYSGSVGYANRVTTFGALGGLEFLQMRSYTFVRSYITSVVAQLLTVN